jgi:hypothetical protein
MLNVLTLNCTSLRKVKVKIEVKAEVKDYTTSGEVAI